MCLSTVVKVVDGKPAEELLTHVSNAKVEGDTITFVDIIGAETVVRGTINDIDLLENKIFISMSS